jgi:hypothetical protein
MSLLQENKRKSFTLLGVYVDDTMVCGPKDETEWEYKMIETMFTMNKLGNMNKDLGV